MIIRNPNFNSETGSIRDPMIVSHEGKYYMTATSPEFFRGDNPGVKIWLSEDLVSWRFVTLAVDRSSLPDDSPCKDRFWAPELFIYGGKYYLTFNAMNEAQAVAEEHIGDHDFYYRMRSFVAVSDRIDGEYKLYPEPLIDEGVLTNDAHLFADDDGTVWLFYTLGGGIYARRFDTDSCKTVGDAFCIIEKGSDGEWDSIGVEGSFVVKRDGKYYHWYSSWTRGYEMGCSVSDRVTGPYKKCADNPIITSGGEPPIKYCGHNSCFTLLDGRDAIAFHGNSDGEHEALCIETIAYPPVRHKPMTEADI